MFCKRSRRAAAGFTLIELLVVLVILGLLAGIVAPNIIGKTETANVQTTKTQIESLSAALDMFRLEVGRYPTSSEGLQALIEEPPGVDRWKGPYLKKNLIPKDAWGNEFHYDSPGEHGSFDLYSLGPDSAEGGDGDNADIVSWQ
jgi:general secretion pathway protein G